jgi:23S rRNA pseudouridine2605 synthase
MMIRSRTLVRVLSKTGRCSRTEAFDLIRSGRVEMDGHIVKEPNAPVPSGARITVDGKVSAKAAKVYIAFHKPAGCITTCKDEKSRKTVYDALGDVGSRVFPVGRLDRDSEGILIFTNDTAFGDFLTDPANKIPRSYEATVSGLFSDDALRRMRLGVDIGRGEISRPRSAKVISRNGVSTVLEITLTEGKNREIRRLCEALGAPVKRLVRKSFGPFRLGGLPLGKRRELDGSFCVDLYSRRR